MFNLQNIDSITFSNKLTTNFACSLSEDGRICLITENGVLIYTLMNYIDNIFSDIAFKKKLVPVPESSISKELEIDFETFYDKMSKDDLFERILRLDLTSKLDHSTPTELKPIAAEWSPKGLLGKSHCVLAVLSNCYGLSIFVNQFNEGEIEQYKCVTNVTKCIVEHNSKKWSNITNVSVDIRTIEWSSRAASSSPIAFVWSHIINTSEEIYAILFVAHPNGSISAWKFNRRNESETDLSDLKFVGKCFTSLENITSMHWKQTKSDGGALCYGNSGGKLAVIVSSNLSQDEILFKDEVIFYDENDQKRVNRIIIIEDSGYTYLIGAKEEFLVVFAIDDTGCVLDETMMDLGNLSITGLCQYKDNILLVLTCGLLKKVTLSIKEGCLNIEEELVSLKLDFTKFKTYGFIISENKVYFGILVYPCRLKDITRDPTPSRFVIYSDTSISPFSTIMSNTDKPLEKYWDCFEILRLISYKEKKFPWNGLDKDIDYDNLTLSQLKSLRWIAKLSEKVYSVIPSITEYNIKPYILLHYMVTIKLTLKRMKKLLRIIATGRKLSDFQMRSLDIQNLFLKELVVMKILEKAKVGEKFIDELIEVMEKANELEYPDMIPCFWCGENILLLIDTNLNCVWD
ncbi:hypothetical protein WA026_020220 [Henosepilachna vigintioctopunctata]|uniref:Transcription factor IIIC 90kDa subunit N-terminal domain-containing protein n=1 Tax=Henosepilachna vigintioctopunctata TaxID=420089 RepID=A0AAW1UAB0_9CUCU